MSPLGAGPYSITVEKLEDCDAQTYRVKGAEYRNGLAEHGRDSTLWCVDAAHFWRRTDAESPGGGLMAKTSASARKAKKSAGHPVG